MNNIRHEVLVPTTPSNAYTAFVYPAVTSRWMNDAASVAGGTNGAYLFHWNDTGGSCSGRFRVTEPGTRLVMTWFAADNPNQTQVEVTFTAEGDGTRVVMVHSGFTDDAAWAALHTQLDEGWAGALQNLKYLYETGHDRRMATRPMLGVYPQELTAERRAELGVEAGKGILITGTVENGAAAKAGLLPGDVLLHMDGSETNGFADIGRVASLHEAGDTIEVVMQRGADTLSLPITLGKRHLMPTPTTREDLITYLSGINAEIAAELAEMLNGESEAVLSRRPEPNEWSVSEQLAHCIVAVRQDMFFNWTIAGEGDGNIPWGGNNEMHLRPLLRTLATAANLKTELLRSLEEPIGVVEAIPDDVLSNKALWGTIAFINSFHGEHIRSHYDQMRAAIASAKETQSA